MAINKLENFIKNLEGRILYVNPSDLDATDSISNQGNSLTRPFKTIQRALIESARFSFVKGNNNDYVERTTILLFPGDHIVDNRPGFGIYKYDSNTAYVIKNDGSEQEAQAALSLKIDSNFDLTSDDNILYKFNSVYGGVIVPRGTSIIGLDLRKTKIRPRYVPNPSDHAVKKTSIFKSTGACYFWQFSIFDGDENGLVFTDPVDFSSLNKSKPTFSHHKLYCFSYADGVNIPKINKVTKTDLNMYYAKLSNAYNLAAGTTKIDEEYKFPESETAFTSQRPEWEIVGSFATDPIEIDRVYSGVLVNDISLNPTSKITVRTNKEHNLSVGTPIKIIGVQVGGVDSPIYNITTKVSGISETDPKEFYYLISYVPPNLDPNPLLSNAFVIIETDTVAGASPYIFNVSMRSEWGMNGLLADGDSAAGFRSTVVAQFTGVSLQKDDRAFVRYNKTSGTYDKNEVLLKRGAELSSTSSSALALHLDPDAIYRPGWETSHIELRNNAFAQIVSVFAIGFTKHFNLFSGSDASITNSNSNFGQNSLASNGFKKKAFEKDNHAFITSIITPRAITAEELDYDWISLDGDKTRAYNTGGTRLYLNGYTDINDVPPNIVQGYRIGANKAEKLHLNINGTVYSSTVTMSDNTSVSEKLYRVTGSPVDSKLTIGSHTLSSGEKVRIFSDDGDLPENLENEKVYYVIIPSGETTTIRLASSRANVENGTYIEIYRGSNLSVVSRVSDKNSNDIGSPIQYDNVNNSWYINVSSTNNGINTQLNSDNTITTTDVTYIKRIEDNRSLDEKLYKLRVVIPKEAYNSKKPNEGFILQESSSTGLRENADASLSVINSSDYNYNKNLKIISGVYYNAGVGIATCELPHRLKVGDDITIYNVKSSNNTTGIGNSGYNGEFRVSNIYDDKTFGYSLIDVYEFNHGNPGTFTSDINDRTVSLPRLERTNLQSNYYIYRNEVITPYIEGDQDGIYHLYILNSGNSVPVEFTERKYSQNVIDLYPQLDKDNINDNPNSAKSFAKRNPLGEVATNNLKNSITRETLDKFNQDFGVGLSTISSVSYSGSGASRRATIDFSLEHGLNSLVVVNVTTAGSGYTPASGIQTYRNVKLLNTGTSTWYGALAKVEIVNGAVSTVEITEGGSGYNNGNVLDVSIGGNVSGKVTASSAGISSVINYTIQIAGLTTSLGGHYRITDVDNSKRIKVATSSNDPIILPQQYGIVGGPSYEVSASSYSSGICTITTLTGNDLFVGNKITAVDANNNVIDQFLVNTRVGINTFTVKCSSAISPKYILKNILSSNSAISDVTEENISVRGVSLNDNEVLFIGGSSDVTESDTQIIVSSPYSGIGTSSRFPLGSYIQIDEEIMRVSRSGLQGSPAVRLEVIRGALGTLRRSHAKGSIIKKIKPIPVEFRRPSVLRSSGHTFEYLGYGPGNYSTSLPDIQVKTLTEREEFLVQSQETSCGSVVYSGMNNNGDYFLGNTKTSASTGKQTTYDIPVPTVTGQDPSRQSVTYDEIIVKDRILVEGGNSGKLLSQFDGPVTFNGPIKFTNDINTSGKIIIKNSTDSSNYKNGALVIEGGVGIAGKLNVNGISSFKGAYIDNIRIGITGDNVIDTITGPLTINASTGNSVAISTNTTISGNVIISENATVTGTLTATNIAGNGSIPIGGIIMWSGIIANIPNGWALCNGLNGTPNLTDRFVVGAGNNYNPGNTGGANSVAISIAQMPSHNHGGNTGEDSPDHTHDLNSSFDDYYTINDNNFDGIGPDGSFRGDGPGQIDDARWYNNTGYTNNKHTHSISSQGGNEAHENRPPYYALAFIMRVL